ncbi:sporulation-delaying protein SdpB family protein [Sphingobacterium sp. Mn56C]|uniref:sporulation-delaying protein SdpB family protein n=1 Tax=Sphingobacterium sp. Mn56C TaxID=3395261 RepID=UPI003BDE0FF8
MLTTNTITLARSLLALSLLLTLLFTPYSDLFPKHHLEVVRIGASGLMSLNLFMWFDTPLIPYILSCIILFISALGFYPRFMCILQSWIAYSLFYSMLIVEGGDQINVILTFLIIPIAILDDRVNGWLKTSNSFTSAHPLFKFNAWCALIFIKIQMSILYFDAAISKIAAPEWSNGTAVYYWFNDPIFGATSFLKILLGPLFEAGLTVSLITWGVILLEIAIAVALILPQKFKYVILPVAVLFHFQIVVVHGLPTFFLAMTGGLILYLAVLDVSLSQNLSSIKNVFSYLWRNFPKVQSFQKQF